MTYVPHPTPLLARTLNGRRNLVFDSLLDYPLSRNRLLHAFKGAAVGRRSDGLIEKRSNSVNSPVPFLDEETCQLGSLYLRLPRTHGFGYFLL
jgi:hypothetical protein